MSRTVALAVTLMLALSPRAFSESATVIPLNELRAQADEALKQTRVSTRDGIDVVFTLVDRLLDEHQADAAEQYLVRGLEQFPWNLKYQLVYAEILAKKGNVEKAAEKASLVFKYAETDELIEGARTLLKKDPLPTFPEIGTLPGTNCCVVLIPFQGCGRWLIVRVTNELSSTLGIPVFIQTVNVKYPPSSRDRRQYVINAFRKQVMKNLGDVQIVDGLKALKLTTADLRTEDNVLKLMHYLTRKSGEEADKQLDAYLRDSIGKDPQWDADQLIASVCRGVDPYRRRNVAYLAITPVDIYAGEYNFLFGLANPSGGILSYRRFTAEFNNETPNQDRLIKRTVMQCLSSVGFVYGIKRCTDPTCARAYPNSLQEHDAKTGALCSECRNGFKAAFGQSQ